jgi:hypothetical protein
MQPHMADGNCRHATQTATADRRTDERYWTSELVATRYVVVLNLGPVIRAKLINESSGGIAIEVRELGPGTAVGQVIEVIYRGKRHAAEIRHFTENENGFLVGLQWQKGRS